MWRPSARGSGPRPSSRPPGTPPPSPCPPGPCGGGLVLLLALAAAVGVLLRLRWREKRRAKLIPADPETGLGSLEELEDAFTRIAGDQSRPSYSLICFHLALEEIGRLRGYDQAKEVLRQGGQILREAAGGSDILARRGEDLLALKRAVRPPRRPPSGPRMSSRSSAPAPGACASRTPGAGGVPPGRRVQRLRPHPGSTRASAPAGPAGRGRACAPAPPASAPPAGSAGPCCEDFTQAMAQKEILLYFQFFADVNTFQVVGGEALSRWYHPKLGLLNPVRYIPLLEEAGRIGELDLYGMEKVCAFLEELGKQGIGASSSPATSPAKLWLPRTSPSGVSRSSSATSSPPSSSSWR